MYMRVLIANLRCEFGRSEPPSSLSLSAFFVKKNKNLIYPLINIRGHIFYTSGGALHLSATDSLPFFATPLKHHLAKCCLLFSIPTPIHFCLAFFISSFSTPVLQDMNHVKYDTGPACLSFLASLSIKLFNYLTVIIIIMFMNLCPHDHDFSSHPPFSFCVASHALLLLYFPRLFFSPLVFFFALTSLLLSTWLGREGVEVGGLAQLPPNPPDEVNLESANKETSTKIGKEGSSDDGKQGQDACELEGIAAASGDLAEAVYTRSVFHSSGRSFVDWSTKWPLEVIYEEYEGEEADHEEEEAASIIKWNRPRSLNNESHNEKSSMAQGFEEWGLCLPDSDDTGSSGSSEGEYEYPWELTTWESLENHHVDMFFMLKEKEEEEEEGMIEILLEGKVVPVPEEDSLIEIDLSLQ